MQQILVVDDEVGIRELYIDTVKGADVWAARSQREVNADLDQRLQEIARKPPEKPIATAIGILRAKKMIIDANIALVILTPYLCCSR